MGPCWGLLLCAATALSVLAANHETLPADRAITDRLQEQPLPGKDLSDALRAITGTEMCSRRAAPSACFSCSEAIVERPSSWPPGRCCSASAPAVKELVDRPRPPPDLVEVRAGASSPSFPFGHVMSGIYPYGFLAYVAVTLPLPRWAAVLLTVLSASVLALGGPSNVWLGVRWPATCSAPGYGAPSC